MNEQMQSKGQKRRKPLEWCDAFRQLGVDIDLQHFPIGQVPCYKLITLQEFVDLSGLTQAFSLKPCTVPTEVAAVAAEDEWKKYLWIPWHGGECPVSGDTEVDVRRRTGGVIRSNPAGDMSWDHRDSYTDIIAYRPVPQPAASEEPWWLIKYEDTEHPDELFTQEKAARLTFEARRVSWACHLFCNEAAVERAKTSLESDLAAVRADMERVKGERDEALEGQDTNWRSREAWREKCELVQSDLTTALAAIVERDAQVAKMGEALGLWQWHIDNKTFSPDPETLEQLMDYHNAATNQPTP